MFPFGSIIFPLALLSGLESFFQWTEKFSPLKKASGLSWVIVSLHQTNLIGILREISYFFFLACINVLLLLIFFLLFHVCSDSNTTWENSNIPYQNCFCKNVLMYIQFELTVFLWLIQVSLKADFLQHHHNVCIFFTYCFK